MHQRLKEIEETKRGMVIRTCNPRTRDIEESRASLGNQRK
jgi:hypothetical protein